MKATLFVGKSNEIVSLVEDRPPIPPGLLIEAFDTLLCIRVSPLQAPTKGAKIQFEFYIFECILISLFFRKFGPELGRHGTPQAHTLKNDAKRLKFISKYRIGFRKPHRYIRID